MLEDFIKAHRNDDIRMLALKRSLLSETDMHYAIEQISGWQKARTKLPQWAANNEITYPPLISYANDYAALSKIINKRH